MVQPSDAHTSVSGGVSKVMRSGVGAEVRGSVGRADGAGAGRIVLREGGRAAQ